jgi:hypothetical protein
MTCQTCQIEIPRHWITPARRAVNSHAAPSRSTKMLIAHAIPLTVRKKQGIPSSEMTSFPKKNP